MTDTTRRPADETEPVENTDLLDTADDTDGAEETDVLAPADDTAVEETAAKTDESEKSDLVDDGEDIQQIEHVEAKPGPGPTTNPSDTTPDQPPPIRLATVGRYILYVGGLMLLGGIAGLVSTVAQSAVYGAESEIIFELDENLEAGFLREDRRLTTQVVTIESRAILEPAGELVDLSPEEFEERLSVEVVSGSEIIRIRTEGPTRSEAVARNQALVDTYLAWLDATDSTATASAIVEDELAEIEAQQAAIRDEILALRPSADRDTELAVLLAQDAALTDQRIELEARKRELVLDDLSQPKFSLLTAPYDLEDRLQPKRLQGWALGVLLGFVVGIAVVFIAEQRRPRLR